MVIVVYVYMFLFCLAIVIYDPIHGDPIPDQQPTAPQDRVIKVMNEDIFIRLSAHKIDLL